MYWLPMLGFESLLFGMAVVKSVKVYKDSKQTHTGKAPNLLVILIRDSVMYFGGVFAVLLTNIIAWAIAPVRGAARGGVCGVLTRCLPARAVLDLRLVSIAPPPPFPLTNHAAAWHTQPTPSSAAA